MKRVGIAVLSALILGAMLAAPAMAQTTAPSGSALPGEAPPIDITKVSAYVSPAIVYEQITWTFYAYDNSAPVAYVDSNGFKQGPLKKFTVTFTCSGFVVSPDGYIATAGHCVDPKGPETVLAEQQTVAAFLHSLGTHYYTHHLSTDTILGLVQDHFRFDGLNTNSGQVTKGTPYRQVAVAWGVAVSGIPSGVAKPALVVALRPFDKEDTALLKVDAQGLSALTVANSSTFDIGTPVVAIGYPGNVDLVADQTFTPTFTSGHISAQKTIENGLLSVYEMDAAMSGGMSGGPTVNGAGEVLGVNSFTINGETQAFNFIRTSDATYQELQNAGVDNTPGEVQDLYAKGLDAYYAGQKAKAISYFNQVLALQPSHQFASEFKTRAASLPNPPAPPASSKTWLWIVIAVLVIGLIVAGLIVWMRNKRTPVHVTPAGEPVAVAPVTPMEESSPSASLPHAERHCTNCGELNPSDAKFCANCGHVL